MNTLFAFLNRMDATAWRALAVSLGLFAAVAVILIVGKTGGFGSLHDLELWLETLRGSPWGLPATIAIFCATAFIGAPQFVLIAATVVAFGPSEGFFFSWIATVVSAALTFLVGRFAGAETLRRYGGDTANRLSHFVGKNAFLASLIVRNVPTAPFIVVNMAFGVSHSGFWAFLAGCAVGVLPKTALVAFAGGSALAAMAGSPWVAIGAALAAAALWLVGMLIARRYLPKVATEGNPADKG
jgi:uncharacterized membrane protein YdjX (TVP38/TMEM64 family)